MTERVRYGSWMRLLGAVLCLWAAACTELHTRGGSGPKESTETGNPPVLDLDAIALVVSASAVHVRGAPGAVTPAVGEVEVTLVATGARQTAAVNPDGSFDVLVDGSENDAFEVRAVHGNSRSEAVYVIRGGAAVGEGEGGSLTCEQRRSLGRAQLTLAEQSADRTCTVDADCVKVTPSAACAPGCGPRLVLSAAGAAEVEAAGAALDQGLCANWVADLCATPTPCNGPQTPPVPVCWAGRCEDATTSAEPCARCLEHEVSWRIVGPGILPALPSPTRYAASGCNQLAGIVNGVSFCSGVLPGCDESGASIQKLNAALLDAEVQQAIAAGGVVGEPGASYGFVYEITVDGSSFEYRTCTELPGEVCTDVPGLDALRRTLDAISGGLDCRQGAHDCASAFDAGQGAALTGVYWHDPGSRSCLPRLYSGSGGNANRYDSRELCEQACPPPSDQAACQVGRRYVEEACVECGAGGGCIDFASRCMKTCTEDEECAQEPAAQGGTGGSCLEGLCSAPACI